jgi:choline dehydrogenase-like flavoprotein
VFALAGDGRLGHVWQLEPGGMSGWSDWHSFEHAIRSAPAVSAAADGRLEVFAIGPNGRLGHVWQQDRHASGDWSDWEDLGPPISERRLAVCQSGGQANLDLGALAKVQSRANSGWPSEMSSELSADFCVIGAGPAGITVSDRLARTGARVVLIESGSWGDNFDAQELNHGDAYGPILKGYLKYLRRGRHRQVQGSASGWRRGWCMPFRAIDYEQRPWVTHSGWPLGADDLQPYEQQAAATLGFDAFEPVQPEGSLIRLTYRYPPDPLVFQAMFLELLEMPDFRAELGCTAVELKISGDQVKSVRVARLAGGELHIEADTIVLAAGGVENARLLLLNEPALPIRNETVGRFFMEHPHVLAGTVRLPDAEALRPYLGGDGQLDVLSLADTAQREERLLNASVQLRPVGPGAEELLGPVECELFVRAEQAPNPNSRVSLGEATDSFGCPQPVLNWDLLDHDWASVVRTAELVAFVLDKRYNATSRLAINLDRPWPWDPAGPAESANPTWGNHHLGTTRMAEQPSEGVVDRNCLVHGTANLYVAGSSVFPTGGCANPTFEIVTLAHRLADHLSAGG